jgi:dCTP deaminase
MILSGKKIKNEINHNIIIEPFNDKQLNPNSYNLRLYSELLYYKNPILDMQSKHDVGSITIPPEGLVLQAGRLYLGRTLEYTKTNTYVPMLEGRSSIGRLGLFIHITAGFGDIGFSGFWTLEMYCIHPIRIYPNVEICQIFYHTIDGDYEPYSSNKYQNNKGIQASMLYKDFEELF